MAKQVNLAEFQMTRTLGCGSFGRVKFAKYKQDGKFYAVKFMKKHEIIKLKQVDHINNEKRLMAQIDYPFVVNMMGYTKDDRFVYIVMECIGGGELFTHLRRARKFSDEQSKFYGAQVAGAFAHIHSKNIIHRDLKPANVLLDKNKDCKVADFGLSRNVTESGRDFTQNIGTVAYMPPEALETSQACGDEPTHCAESSELLGTKWDVYSYAIMYLYMLTRQRPYRGLDNRQIMIFVFMKKERPLIPENSLTDPETALIASMWIEDPRKRPTFQEILQKQYAMYRHNSEGVRILQTPANKTNLTKRNLHTASAPILELTPMNKKIPSSRLSKNKLRASVPRRLPSQENKKGWTKGKSSKHPPLVKAVSMSQIPRASSPLQRQKYNSVNNLLSADGAAAALPPIAERRSTQEKKQKKKKQESSDNLL